jgi:hypothetical protein
MNEAKRIAKIGINIYKQTCITENNKNLFKCI